MSFPYPYLFAHWKIPGTTWNVERGTLQCLNSAMSS